MALMLLVKEREILNKFQVLLKYGYDATNKFKKGGGAQCNAIIYYAILSLPYMYIKHSNQVFWVYRICIAVKMNTCISNNLHLFFSWTMTNIVHRNLINGNWCLKKKIRNEICCSWIVAFKEKEKSIFIRKYFCWTSNL